MEHWLVLDDVARVAAAGHVLAGELVGEARKLVRVDCKWDGERACVSVADVCGM